MVLALLIAVRDGLIALALAWVGVTFAPAERAAPEAPTPGRCTGAASCGESARPAFGGRFSPAGSGAGLSWSRAVTVFG